MSKSFVPVENEAGLWDGEKFVFVPLQAVLDFEQEHPEMKPPEAWRTYLGQRTVKKTEIEEALDEELGFIRSNSLRAR